MDKKKKSIIMGIIIIIILITLLIIIPIINKSSNRTKLSFEDYIEKLGYVSDGGSSYYYKQISDTTLDEYFDKKKSQEETDFETNYFNTLKYQFSKNKREYTKNIETTLNQIYDIKTDTMTYNYRLVIENSSFIFSGDYKYDEKEIKFTCSKDYAYNFKMDDEDEETCEYLKNEATKFYEEVLDMLANNMRMINKIKKTK